MPGWEGEGGEKKEEGGGEGAEEGVEEGVKQEEWNEGKGEDEQAAEVKQDKGWQNEGEQGGEVKQEEWKQQGEQGEQGEEVKREEWKQQGEQNGEQNGEQKQEEWKAQGEQGGDAVKQEEWKGQDEQGGEGKCLEYIVYDKPVKTGSTAVRDALVAYLEKRGGEWVECTFEGCNELAEKILSGEMEKKNLIEHMLGQEGLIERLGQAGYYKVTSIRDPRSRWESAYRYNKAQGARHYGIDPDVSYGEFMSRMPPCSLYDFYDKKGGACEGDLEERIRKIVERYNEVIDLYEEEVKGQLHSRLAPYISVSNKSPEYNSDGAFDEGRLTNETRLYEALKRRRVELFGKEPTLC